MRGPTYMEKDRAAIAKGLDSYNIAKAQKDLTPLRRLLPYLRPHALQLLYGLLALIVAASAVLAMGILLRRVIDEGITTGHIAKLDEILLLLSILIVTLAGATFARFYFVSWVGERMVATLRDQLYHHLLRLSPSFFETAKSGDIISRINVDTTLLQVLVGSSFSVGLRNLLLLIGGATMLIVTSNKLALVVFTAIPMVLIPIYLLGRRVKQYSKLSQEKIADVASGVEETIFGIRTIQAFGREDVIEKNFNDKVAAAFAMSLKRILARSWMVSVVIALVFGAVTFILWRGSQDVLSNFITGGQLAAFIFYSVIVAGAAGAISEVLGDVSQAAGAMERLSEFLNVKPDIKAPDRPHRLPNPGYGEIHFDRVSFFYPSRPQAAAVDHFDMRVRSGEKIAIVGPSGAGKSTLFQLLLRFYDPQVGAVWVDNFNVAEVDPRDLRHKISYVPQDVVIFSTDIITNIRMARPEATDDEVAAAAEAAKAHEFISELPQGYKTFAGEKGVRLSGGQKQRIGLARAALRNTPILLLDEATSALDSQSEKAIQTAFANVMQGRSTLIIAHRLSTIANCNRIVVIDKGRIVETGTHDDLMAKEGLYAKLSRMQLRA